MKYNYIYKEKKTHTIIFMANITSNIDDADI